MNVEAIYEPYIYSVKYDNQAENEYDRLFDAWNDMSYVVSFFEQHEAYLNNTIWEEKLREPEAAALRVRDEANELEDLFEQLYQNTLNGEQPDFDSHFQFLDGEYKYVILYVPMKSYGTINPSFLRIYAIKLQSNTFLITGGGIKLAKKNQDAPELQDHVIRNIDEVREWLISNGVADAEDL